MSQFPEIPPSPTPQVRRERGVKDALSKLTAVPEIAERDAKLLPPEGQDVPAPVQTSKPILSGRQGLNAGLEFVQTIVDEVTKLNERSKLNQPVKPDEPSKLNGK